MSINVIAAIPKEVSMRSGCYQLLSQCLVQNSKILRIAPEIPSHFPIRRKPLRLSECLNEAKETVFIRNEWKSFEINAAAFTSSWLQSRAA
jgi:hypothetical protein